MYVHVPKTAGFSLTKQLFGGLGTEHASALVWRSLIADSEWPDRYKFAFVRNPANRFISAFWYLKKGGMHIDDRRWADNNLVGINSAEELMDLRPTEIHHVLEWIHFRPMVSFICDEQGSILVDFVGRYENLADDFAEVLTAIKLPLTPLHALNVTERYDEKFSKWTPAHKKKFMELYINDYHTFNYPASD